MPRDKAYYEAEKKIEEARRSGATELDLSSMGITELPPEIWDLKNLKVLDLAYHITGTKNQLTQLPIEVAQLTQLQSLNLSDNQLTALPESLGQLTQLQSLNLSRNQLTALPESLGQLTQLQSLNLYYNRLFALPNLKHSVQLHTLSIERNNLEALPDWLGQLTELRRLNIAGNKLTELPNQLDQLINLKELILGSSSGGNDLSEIPPFIQMMHSLETLWLYDCKFTSLPIWLGELRNLNELHLSLNRFTDLPSSLVQLEDLTSLYLASNPLNPELAAADKQGLGAVKKYLREMAKGVRKRFEAKLLILGDGNEGKTCVSRALRGLDFTPQVTTRGVDVEQWKFPHPNDQTNKEKTITLNIWDFEGQEINHQTHQFFLTADSLYLLVFKCRDQFLRDRAEYWLDTIRARAPKARVAIVITECETRSPYVPEDKLQSNYGDLLVGDNWLFAVGCADTSGVFELQNALMRWAADLNFMGRDWPDSYGKAESALQEQRNAGISYINRSKLHSIFAKARIDEEGFEDVASSTATLGVITQFPDCPDLRDFIVLQPQWLTKAISEIMEDGKLADDRGEISLQRMHQIWDNNKYKGLFTIFHNCMKEFELCYDLDDPDRRCLVPLRFGYIKPEIPWTSGQSIKERRVNYKLNIHPPTGLMSRLIVKTHHMIVATDQHPNGVYWHNGVFLRTGQGSLCSEALCEFDSGERTLSVTVRAAFPQNMIEQIHAYVKAGFSFFSGLEPVRSFGCIKVDSETNTETQCHGAHSEDRISFALESREKIACEHGRHHIDPMQLIWGISSFGESIQQIIQQEMNKTPDWAKPIIHNIATLLMWANRHNELLEQVREGQEALAPDIKQEMEQKLREYLGYIGQMLDDRELTSAPGIISINTVDRSAWNPKSYFTKAYVLTPFCECEQNIHPCEDGSVEFSKDREWWSKTAPWIARGTKVLSVGLQLAFAGMPLTMEKSAFDAIKHDVAFMKELTKHIELEADDADDSIEEITARFNDNSFTDIRGDNKDIGLMRATLSRFLEEVAPDNYRARQWGSLHRVRMSDRSYRWLCEDCKT